MFKKLKAEAEALDSQVTSERLINFANSGYHLREWIANGDYSQAIKDDLGRLFSVSEYLVCRDIANGSKHFKITKYKPKTKGVNSKSGFGVGRFGKGPFGHGEESISIEMNDGTSWNAIEFKDLILSLWQEFFKKHSIDE